VSYRGSALDGIKVVDLGQWMAGPTAARLLADNGAQVVHVDPPGGWRWSAQADAVLNAGKRRVELDLDLASDLAEMHRLVAECDVLVENFAPGTLARFGLDADSVRAAHPRVVYLSLPGFASTDAEHATVQALEGVIASATGQFSDMGVNRVLMGIAASYSPLPLGSAYAAVFGAMAVGLALRARIGHGRGDHIEVPIASSLLEALAYNSMHVDDVPRRYLSRREQAIEGGVRDLAYEDVQPLLDPFYRTYWCADGRPFYLVAVSHRQHSRRVLEVLGIWSEAVAAGLPVHDPYLPTSQWPEGTDCTLLAHPISEYWSDWLSERMSHAFAARPSHEWEDEFGDRGIPAVCTRTTREWLRNDHARTSGLLIEDRHSELGDVRRMGQVLWTEQVPGALGVERPSAQDPAAGWLDGLLVVDLTNVIAGPTIGSTLARYGARVVKVDLPQPTFDPWNTILCGLHSNRGKESVLLDARSALGRPALAELLSRADVLTVNASDQQLERLGLTAHDLAALAPGAVLCHLDAWSGPDGGSWRQRSGYDDLVQAATGIMARFGGGLDTPEEHAHFGTIDVLAGLAAATATAFALYAREATGSVHVARSSLAAAGQLIQAAYMIDHDGARDAEPSGRAALGESATYRLYATSDGWAFFVIPPGTLAELGTGIGRSDLDRLPEERLELELTEAFRAQCTSHWQGALAPLGVTVQPLRTLAQQRAAHTSDGNSPWGASSYHFTRFTDHEVGRSVTLVAPVAVRPRHARIVVPADAPKYGAHTETVLTELGYSTADIEQMVTVGAAGRAWSDEYLPS
jgi:crotonobetainyl-CoA:carnitine CoA-transferase CaiB-like acyl-CoA transferase